jgi:hypothetical protein
MARTVRAVAASISSVSTGSKQQKYLFLPRPTPTTPIDLRRCAFLLGYVEEMIAKEGSPLRIEGGGWDVVGIEPQSIYPSIHA